MIFGVLSCLLLVIRCGFHFVFSLYQVVNVTYFHRSATFPSIVSSYTDDPIDLAVENLTLSGCNFSPNVITVEAHNLIKISPYSAITDEQHHEFTIAFWSDGGD